MEPKVDEQNILNCGLCNKLLNVPKTLPCLHMFCETCLCYFISSRVQIFPTAEARNIQCPVCETNFTLPREIGISTFVSQVPTHDNIDAIIKWDTKTLNGPVCGPCATRQNVKKTNIWCVECKEGLCDECYEDHCTSKALMSHTTVDVTKSEIESVPINVDAFCLTHEDQKLEHFCEEHEKPCCHTCITTQHGHCTNVTTLEGAARSRNKKKDSFNLIKRLDEALDNLSNDIEERDIFLQTIEADRDEVISKITSFRREINNRLDALETKFKNGFETLHCEKCAELKTKTDEFQNTRKIISNLKRLLQLLLKRSSDINIFLEKQQIERKLKEQEDILAKLSSEAPYKFRYKVNFSPELVDLADYPLSLGTVKCVKVTPVQLSIGEFLDVPGESPKSKNRHYQLNELMTFTPNKCDGRRFHGIELLPDGILLTHDNNLYLLDNEGNLQKEIKLPGKLFDITMTNGNEAAVTRFTNQFGVCIVNIDDMTIKQENVIRDSSYIVHGVASYGNKLILACRDKIVILGTNGSLIKEIKTPSPYNHPRYVTSISDSIFCYTNHGLFGNSVVCIDMNGTIIFTYTHTKLKEQRGITSDSDGVIYVAGHDSNNVHQISPDGELIEILLCAKDRIINPYAINFDRRNKTLVLSHSESMISVYQLKE